ncbi:long-chain fatty acid--CoA ligase [Streptomyces sp. NBC_01718]|uniref:long-chain-fatty-acid--CoA ligase n=1 Tax=Streptomyces sp. NBC_01718 TaxID=2975919 RepID=UPI00352BFC96
MNLCDLLSRSADRHSARTAVSIDEQHLTYAQLENLSGRAAALLAAWGVAPGDRVAVMLPNMLEFPVLYYGVLRAGAIVVPMNPLLKSREVAHYLKDSGARLIFAFGPSADEATAGAAGTNARVVRITAGSLDTLLAEHEESAPSIAGDQDDTAVILYTSGTTGVPKGAELTHANLVRNADLTARSLFALTPDDSVMGCLPLFHAFGQTCAMNAAVGAGARLVLLSRFEPAAALETIARERMTIFEGVPTMYASLLGADHDGIATSSLRLCVSGGSALPVEVLHAFEAAFDCPVLEGFGMSETSPVVSFNHPHKPRKAGSIGTPVEGVEMRLVDEKDGVGELCLRGHNVMKGYWGRPEATAETIRDGWLHTGDLARVDADGYYFIVDRKKDLVIRGGFNVYPREMEEVLYEHPAVAEAAVLGIPHATLGEEVAAAVALRPGSGTTAEEIKEFMKERVAPYKYPREVWILDALPKGATGKILKREIVRPEPERR